MSKTTNKFLSEVRRQRGANRPRPTQAKACSRWAAVTSIAAEIGCTAQTPHEWR